MWKCLMLQEVVDEYIASLVAGTQKRRGTNQNTVVAYRNDLHQLCLYLTRQGLENWPHVTREHIAAYLLEMREGQAYRPTTIARKLAALKSFFRYMHSTGIIAIDPVERLESPRIQKDLPQVLSAEQITSLFSMIEVETLHGKRDLAMLQVLYATGMRVTEL